MLWPGVLNRIRQFGPAPSAPLTLEARALGAYLGLAVGDALGATVEFLTPNEIRHQIGLHRHLTGGGWLKLRPGMVTDDTTMSLALGEAILLSGGRVDALLAAQAFDQWMRGKPVDIGNTVRRNLMRFRRTGEPCAPPSEHDAGNGAAMRLLPAALATFGLDADSVREAVLAQAHVTHHSPLSDAACLTLTGMLHALLAGADKKTVLQQHVQPLIQQYPVFGFRARRCDNPSGYIVDTLQAVFQAFFDTDTLEDCLIDVVNRGGDADTTGAIAGMLAGAHQGPKAIPRRWLSVLDADTRAACELQSWLLLPATSG